MKIHSRWGLPGRRAVLVLATWALSMTGGWSQGLVVFDNRVMGVVVAPVYGVESDAPTLVKHGNTPDGTPPGTQDYAGEPLAGSAFTAQLFGAGGNVDPRHLYPLNPTTVFLTDTRSGFVEAPPLAITVPGVPLGRSAQLQLRAWANRGGTITNWLQVLADPTIPRGQSSVFVSGSLGGLMLPPANLTGLESFNLATSVPSPFDIRINFQPGPTSLPGYLSDDGSPYGPRGNGRVYGWNVTHQSQAHAQNAAISPDARYDTFVQMNPGLASVWEMEVTNGLYWVHVVLGDPLRTEGEYHLTVEGVPAVEGTLDATRHWLENSLVAVVTDGRLTITGADQSQGAPLAFLELGSTEAKAPSLSVEGSTVSSEIHLQIHGQWGLRYQVEYSTNLLNWWPTDAVGPQIGDQIELTAPTSDAGPLRFYRARVLVP